MVVPGLITSASHPSNEITVRSQPTRRRSQRRDGRPPATLPIASRGWQMSQTLESVGWAAYAGLAVSGTVCARPNIYRHQSVAPGGAQYFARSLPAIGISSANRERRTS
jgi:hypothetical protein